MTKTPPRGFTAAELAQRCTRLQSRMAPLDLHAVVLTTEPEVRYYSGFDSQFWESPTRPWFLVVPGTGKPIAVIPAIGAAGFAGTWLDDIRTWTAPRPADDGVSLLTDTLAEVSSPAGSIGFPLGHESHLRMPAADFLRLREALGPRRVIDARPLLRALRAVKSPAEIEKIRYVCELTSLAFEALPEGMAPGMSEREICKALQLDLLRRGADAVPYLIGASGPGGYDNIIMGPTDRRLADGDVLVIDTGARFDGYYCDFDRNFAFSSASDAARRAYRTAWEATEAGFAAARPGATTSEVWAAMWQVLAAGGALGEDVGRMGHGLGLQLTEWPSNMPGDDTVLEPGMVLTLEPGMRFAPGQLIVHEENVVIEASGARWLTRRAPPGSCRSSVPPPRAPRAAVG